MSSERITHMSQHELLNRIHKDRTAFAAHWHGLTEDQMTRRPGPQEDWSIKDLIAHITWWDNDGVERVNIVLTGQQLEPYGDFAVANARIFEDYKDRPLPEILADFDAAQTHLDELVGSLSDAQINDMSYDPSRDVPRILSLLIGHTFNHYEEHLPDLEGYVQSITG